jgi:hypothetical protein
MAKTHEMTFAGQRVTLKFNMGTLRRMKALNGNDPFRSVNTDDVLGLVEMAGEVINAGIMTELGTDKAYFSQDQLDDHLDLNLAAEVIIAFNKAYTPDVPEVKEDTQPTNAQ